VGSLSNKQYPEHNFGSICFLPSLDDKGTFIDKERYLYNVIKLFLEYKLSRNNFYGENHETWRVCWNCGCSTPKIRTVYGYNDGKYHLTCPECGEFWVKNYCSECTQRLIKHNFNYHTEKDFGQHWYVNCSACNDVYLKK
jgi:hypothetical protein